MVRATFMAGHSPGGTRPAAATGAETGTLIAMDGDSEVRTTHANSVMVMPVPHPKVGQTAVRIGRFRLG